MRSRIKRIAASLIGSLILIAASITWQPKPANAGMECQSCASGCDGGATACDIVYCCEGGGSCSPGDKKFVKVECKGSEV